MTAPQPGWYPDPASAATSAAPPSFRWWDGRSWTDSVSTSATAPPPADPQPVDTQPVDTQPVDAESGAGRRSKPVRLVALALGITVMIGGGMVGTFGWLGGHDRTAESPLEPAAPAHSTATAVTTPHALGSQSQDDSNGPTGRLDERTREARLANATMIMPPAPYDLINDAATVPGMIDAMFVAEAPVHPRYNGTDTWSATVALAHLPSESVDPTDSAEFARESMDQVSERFFGHRPTKIKKLRYAPIMIDGQLCAEVAAQVHYRIDQLASRYDSLRVIGCQTSGDGVIAAISAVPDDADPAASRLAAESLESFGLR